VAGIAALVSVDIAAVGLVALSVGAVQDGLVVG
jgi:hypothetical protein